MIRRSFYYIGILLFCIGLGACQRVIKIDPDLEQGRNETDKEISEFQNESQNNNLAGNNNNQNDTSSNTSSEIKSSGNNVEEDGEIVDTMKQSILRLSDLITEGTDVIAFQNAVRNYPAETVLDTTGVSSSYISSLFYQEEIKEDIKTRIKGKSYGDTCNIPYSDLRYIRVLHHSFEGQVKIGELIVNKSIAEDVVDIFKELHEINYPIERMVLVDEYNADDVTSMEANNSSAFNYRTIAGTNRISLHSYGMAIDINPKYNPYIYQIDGRTVISPKNGEEYADRSLDCNYYIFAGDPCYQAFIDKGFTWGGEWKNSKDYQHFQKTLE